MQRAVGQQGVPGRSQVIASNFVHAALDLTDLELETAARACHALAYQEEQAAQKMENPTMRGPIETTAKRAAALAEKFEQARRKGLGGRISRLHSSERIRIQFSCEGAPEVRAS